ncbi:MAG: hypothetical protein DWQ10_07570, partial [Calditrichaeota bacterium]
MYLFPNAGGACYVGFQAEPGTSKQNQCCEFGTIIENDDCFSQVWDVLSLQLKKLITFLRFIFTKQEI